MPPADASEKHGRGPLPGSPEEVLLHELNGSISAIELLIEAIVRSAVDPPEERDRLIKALRSSAETARQSTREIARYL